MIAVTAPVQSVLAKILLVELMSRINKQMNMCL